MKVKAHWSRLVPIFDIYGPSPTRIFHIDTSDINSIRQGLTTQWHVHLHNAIAHTDKSTHAFFFSSLILFVLGSPLNFPLLSFAPPFFGITHRRQLHQPSSVITCPPLKKPGSFTSLCDLFVDRHRGPRGFSRCLDSLRFRIILKRIWTISYVYFSCFVEHVARRWRRIDGIHRGAGVLFQTIPPLMFFQFFFAVSKCSSVVCAFSDFHWKRNRLFPFLLRNEIIKVRKSQAAFCVDPSRDKAIISWLSRTQENATLWHKYVYGNGEATIFRENEIMRYRT